MPIYLIIVFNRKRGNEISKTKIYFPEKLNTNGIVIHPTENYYLLYGVIKCDFSSQQFFAYCRSTIDNHWYLYSDSKVTSIKDEGEIYGNGLTCALFYKCPK